MTLHCPLVAAVLLLGCVTPLAAQQPLEAFLHATSSKTREQVRRAILEARPDLDTVYRRLRRGRKYRQDVAKGTVDIVHEIDGVLHPCRILVPADYRADQAYPLRFELHGGMGAPAWKIGSGDWCKNWRPVPGQIVVLPAGWRQSMWWHRSQLQNLRRILDHVKRRYHVDENRIVLSGNSDGGAAVFFLAMRWADPWAGFAGFVAPPDRLRRQAFEVDGQMHMSNLAGQRFLFTYGGADRLVPAQHIRSYMRLFAKAGALLDWKSLAGQGHSLRLPRERDTRHARFYFHRRRDPLPDQLSWATENPVQYGLRSWLQIDELGPGRKVRAGEVLPRLGTPIQLRGASTPQRPFAKVQLRREGNLVLVESYNARRFRLLISPEEFDLEAPIRVEREGEILFEGKVQPSLEVLLRWAARLDERSRLFVAEIPLQVD